VFSANQNNCDGEARIMKNEPTISIYIVHYSLLIDRKKKLNEMLSESNINAEWITEKNYFKFSPVIYNSKRTLGISNKIIGMDLGVNSRSLTVSRRKARLQGYILYLRSYISKNQKITTGSLPSQSKLPTKWFELSCMHLSAIKNGILSGSDWILVLEDDALPTRTAFRLISEIVKKSYNRKTWINLNSGAGLKWTLSDPIPDENGLFLVKPSSTRCSVAYLISKDLGIKIIESAECDGLPDWLPIDVYFQVMLRKFSAKAYWQEPPSFAQGSETGEYKSQLEGHRKISS